MAHYSSTIETTFSNLAENLAAATESSNVYISDPANINIYSSSTSGSLGYIFKNNIKSGILFDLTATETEKSSLTGLDSAFEGCSNISYFGALPTSSLTSATSLFKDCTSLIGVDVDALTYIKDASSMFKNCSSLIGIKVNDLIDVEKTDEMFSGCTSLISIDISMFQDVTSALSMFLNDSSLVTLIVSQGFLTDLSSSAGMLSGCSALTKIIRDDPAKIDRHLYVRGNTEINGKLSVSDASNKDGALIRGILEVDDIEILNKLGMISNAYHSVSSDDSSHATVADSIVGKLTLRNGNNSLVFNGATDSTFEVATGAVAYPHSIVTSNTYSNNVGTQSYDGTSLVTSSIYEPNQSLNSTDSPTFNIVTAALSGNASTATTADKVGHTLTITASNTYSDTATGTTTYNGAADITQNVYLPNQSLNTTDSPEFASVYLSTDNVVSYDMTSSQTMTSSQVKYPAIKLTGALTADATLMLYFNTTTLVGRKSYHVLNECTTANAQQSIVITTNLGTTVTLSVKKNQAAYVTDIFVDASGNVLLFAATRASTSDSLEYPLTISNSTLSTATAYNGSSAVTVYSPGQLLESTSSPTFANPTVTTINGLGFTPKWSAPFIPYVRTDGVTEIGKYVDFHGDAEDSNDYDARIAVTHNSTYRGHGEMPIHAAHLTAAKFSMTHINLYGDSLTFTSPLSDANVSQCWAKAYGNILRIHVAMPIATQTIANSTIVFNLSGAMPTMAYSPTRLVLICDSISLGRYTADIDLDQSGVARIYFAGVAISGSVADISGIYGDCMLTLN